MQLKRDWPLSNHKVTSKIKGHYEKRQYEGERRSINAARADNRWRLSFETSIELADHWQLLGAVHADWFHSNVKAADYNQERLQFGLNWRF